MQPAPCFLPEASSSLGLHFSYLPPAPCFSHLFLHLVSSGAFPSLRLHLSWMFLPAASSDLSTPLLSKDVICPGRHCLSLTGCTCPGPLSFPKVSPAPGRRPFLAGHSCPGRSLLKSRLRLTAGPSPGAHLPSAPPRGRAGPGRPRPQFLRRPLTRVPH